MTSIPTGFRGTSRRGEKTTNAMFPSVALRVGDRAFAMRTGDRGLHFDARPGLACLVQSPALNSFQLLCTCHATGYVAACAAQSSSMPGGSVALSTAAANAAAADSIRPLIQQAWSFCTTGHWAAQHTDIPPTSLAPEPSATPSITLPPSVYEFYGSGVMGLSGTWDECPPW